MKISDLGYSVMGEKETFLPNSWPWTAPEWTKRRFDIPSTKKMDIYSLGLLCFWLLFSNVEEKPVLAEESSVPFCILEEGADFATVKLIRSHDILPQFAKLVIENVKETNKEQKRRLSQFFERTVRTSPEHRTMDLTELAQLLDPQ